MCHAHAPPTYACKCMCMCICICVTGNSQKHKSQICRMPHGDTQPTRGRRNEEQRGRRERRRGRRDLQTATGNWLRHIHITGMARRHLATHSHVTHDLLLLCLCLSLPLYLCPSLSQFRYPNHLKTLARHLGVTPPSAWANNTESAERERKRYGGSRGSRRDELLQQLIHSDCVHTHGLG